MRLFIGRARSRRICSTRARALSRLRAACWDFLALTFFLLTECFPDNFWNVRVAAIAGNIVGATQFCVAQI